MVCLYAVTAEFIIFPVAFINFALLLERAIPLSETVLVFTLIDGPVGILYLVRRDVENLVLGNNLAFVVAFFEFNAHFSLGLVLNIFNQLADINV